MLPVVNALVGQDENEKVAQPQELEVVVFSRSLTLRGILLWDLSAGTGKLCILGTLVLLFIWNCFVSCLLFFLFYVSLRILYSSTHS